MTHYPVCLLFMSNSSPSFSSPFLEVNVKVLLTISKARLTPVALVRVYTFMKVIIVPADMCKTATAPIQSTRITGINFKLQGIYPLIHWTM